MFLYFGFVLLVCVRFAGSTVVDDAFMPCKSFFYKGVPPQGLTNLTQIKSICQRHQNRYHFATVYSSKYRIPLYSAYKLERFACNTSQPARRSQWYIEPQLSGINLRREMDTERTSADTYKIVQAINIDYQNTNYDRGHLNPNSYQCDNSRTATFTLTNAVPQEPCFNQQIWKKMEERSKSTMQELCNFRGARRYFVTGAVPGAYSIPSKLNDEEGDRPREYNRVNVPFMMWTAACCDTSSTAVRDEDKDKGFSFAYYGENIPDPYVIPYSVPALEKKLAEQYGVNIFKVFVDECFSVSENSKKANAKVGVPVRRAVARDLTRMAKADKVSSVPWNKRSLAQTVSSSLEVNKRISLKRLNIADADFGLFENRLKIIDTRDLFARVDLVPILTANYKRVAARQSAGEQDATSLNSTSGSLLAKTTDSVKVEGTKNVTGTGSTFDAKGILDSVIDEYVIVPLTENTITATGSRCREDHSCDYNDQTYKWCYIDWNNHWDYCCHEISKCGFGDNKNYAWCYTNIKKTEWAYCSHRSSMISVSGKACVPGHECGLHGGSNHWCYTDMDKSWEYCCQPWHTCAKHGESRNWCWVGWKNQTSKQFCDF